MLALPEPTINSGNHGATALSLVGHGKLFNVLALKRHPRFSRSMVGLLAKNVAPRGSQPQFSSATDSSLSRARAQGIAPSKQISKVQERKAPSTTGVDGTTCSPSPLPHPSLTTSTRPIGCSTDSQIRRELYIPQCADIDASLAAGFTLSPLG